MKPSKESLANQLGLSHYDVDLEDIDYETLVCYHDEIVHYLDENKATREERRYAWKWIREGNSIYNNPGDFYGEDGNPLDFIQGIRAIADMEEEFFQRKDCYPYNTLEDLDGMDLPF